MGLGIGFGLGLGLGLGSAHLEQQVPAAEGAHQPEEPPVAEAVELGHA